MDDIDQAFLSPDGRKLEVNYPSGPSGIPETATKILSATDGRLLQESPEDAMKSSVHPVAVSFSNGCVNRSEWQVPADRYEITAASCGGWSTGDPQSSEGAYATVSNGGYVPVEWRPGSAEGKFGLLEPGTGRIYDTPFLAGNIQVESPGVLWLRPDHAEQRAPWARFVLKTGRCERLPASVTEMTSIRSFPGDWN
jgi:hypothetical protein